MVESQTIEAEDKGQRIDVWLHAIYPHHSRARWQQIIKEHQVLVNEKTTKPNYKLHANDHITFNIPKPKPVEVLPEDIPINFLYQDTDLMVINKQPGLVIHPAPGHHSGTLVNALLHHCKDLTGIGGEIRPGIVHRLDKDTSGVLIAAKNEEALNRLQEQFKSREVKKTYQAMVWARPRRDQGTIKTNLGRDPGSRKKMSVLPDDAGRHAITHYEMLEAFDEVTHMKINIETGRTHQIRVHMAHLGHPIVGDRLYGRARANTLAYIPDRQMLHASTLSFNHPGTGEPMEFEAPLTDDFTAFIDSVRTP